MSSSKVLLGAVVLAGGAYYYDQNVQPILPWTQKQFNDGVQKVEHQTADFTNKLTKKIDEGKNELAKKSQELTEQIKDSNLYSNLQSSVEDIKKVTQNTIVVVEDDSNPAVNAVRGYIDFVNKLGNSDKTVIDVSSVEKAPEAKKAWFDWFKGETKDYKKDLDKAKAEAEAKGNEWFAWGSKKSDEFANEANKTIDAQKAELNSQKAQLQSNYESTKKDLNDRYVEEKNRAIKSYESAKAQYDEVAAALKNSPDPLQNKKLRKAQDDLSSALSNLKAYGDDLYTEYYAKIKDILSK
ncbi:uncharacterized protein RJT20DRAFT_4491 [Scheffersomyces xylosifermentans]|uniref:uncharacterized protein n=1 Tax=Scheffersomyces xylosifermentans TaxID=1304137 RepID=UPI00315C706B